MIVVEPAAPEDLPAITSLLERAGLPLAGVAEHLQSALVARAGGPRTGEIVGCAALEEYAGGAVLRSVAVADRFRGAGVGQQLTAAALDLAAARRHRDVYLLTTTAAGFFPRFGFSPVDRAEIPEDVRGSVEFTTACPSTALAMRAALSR